MPTRGPRHGNEEFARRGDAIYDRDVDPPVGPEDEVKYVVIDIETGTYEIDRDELTASDRLLAPRLAGKNFLFYNSGNVGSFQERSEENRYEVQF